MAKLSTFVALACLLSTSHTQPGGGSNGGGDSSSSQLSFSLLTTYGGLAQLNGTTESVEYDADNNVYYLVNRDFGGEIDSLNGDYPLYNANPNLVEDIGEGTEFGEIGSTGMVYSNGFLYVANMGDGSVVAYDVETKSFNNSVFIEFGANGLCQDPDDEDMLYVTNVGLDFTDFPPTDYIDEYSGLWSINISESEWTVTRLYAGNDSSLMNPSGNATYIFRPNGCAVQDGKVFMVETRADLSGSLGIYEISTDTFSYNYNRLTVSGDGILINDDYIFVTSWTDDWYNLDGAGSLYYWQIGEFDENFEVGLTGLTGPADMTFGPEDGLIVIPSLLMGDIYFIRISDRTSFELYDDYISLDGGASTESVQYDADNNVYYFVDRNVVPGQVGWINANYPQNTNDSDLMTDIMNQTGNNTLIGCTGMEIMDDEYLYINNWLGNMVQFDIENKISVSSIDVSSAAGLNGLCADPDDADMLYATNIGLDFDTFSYVDGASGLWSINVATREVTRLYSGNESSLENDYIFRPNGCNVYDGIVYLVETRADLTGSLGMYDIATNEFTYDNEILSVSGDGIININDVFVVSAWCYDWAATTECGSLMALEMGYDDKFKTVISGLTSPADITLNTANNIITIPELNTGAIKFVQFEYLAPTSQPTVQPTPYSPMNETMASPDSAPTIYLFTIFTIFVHVMMMYQLF